MKKKTKELSVNEISVLKEMFEPETFASDFDLVYESQVPNTGLVLLSGKISMLKRKKVMGTILPGTLLGVHHLISNVPSKVGIRILGNSEVIMIHKSAILEALDDKNSELFKIIKEVV